jgi:hypothetical protein
MKRKKKIIKNLREKLKRKSRRKGLYIFRFNKCRKFNLDPINLDEEEGPSMLTKVIIKAVQALIREENKKIMRESCENRVKGE